MKRTQQIIAVILLAVGGAFLAVYASDARTQTALVRWWYGDSAVEQPSIADSLHGMAERFQGSLPHVADTQTKTMTPEPLRSHDATADGTLSGAGIVQETNRHRSEAGLPPLATDSRLAQAALAKVEDMFARQYFEHVAPDGTDVAALASAAGYDYIVVGENLALGGYDSDADLVQAWMDSPGHRANILHKRFTEIGVAAKRGMFEGQEVWLAVQEFGKPRSDCPSPSAALNAQITANNEQLDAWQAELEEQKRDIEQTSTVSPAYNRKVREHNRLVARYNELLEETKRIVSEYNAQVQAFNACAEG